MPNRNRDDFFFAPCSNRSWRGYCGQGFFEVAACVAQGCGLFADFAVRARNYGAADKEIYDTVLIAAAFCMRSVGTETVHSLANVGREEVLAGDEFGVEG